MPVFANTHAVISTAQKISEFSQSKAAFPHRLLDCPMNARRHSHSNDVVRHVARNDGAGADHSPTAHYDSWENDRTKPQMR